MVPGIGLVLTLCCAETVIGSEAAVVKAAELDRNFLRLIGFRRDIIPPRIDVSRKG